MKRRLSAVLLALGLSVSALSMGVYAEETETTAAEQVTEATTDAEETEQATEAATDAAAEDLAELESEEAEAESEAAEESAAETEAVSQEDQMKEAMAQYLTEISAYSDEQLNQMLESDDASTQLIAANWKSVKDELGNFAEITSLDSSVSEDGSVYTINCSAKYDKLDNKTDVTVVYEVDQKNQSVSFEWEVNYTLGKLMERAGMNTIMGIGIVFLALLFLSWLIGKLHYIPDMIEKRTKNAEPAAPAPAAPVSAPAVEEEDLTDDLELVAVITAAIAASEGTSSDGFVVRSIKKANKRNWQRA